MSEARKLLEEASQALVDCKHPNAGSIKSSKCPVCALANRIGAYLASPEEAQPEAKAAPVAWMYEDELPENYPYDAMYTYSDVIDGVRMFPVFLPSPEAAREVERDAARWRYWKNYWMNDETGAQIPQRVFELMENLDLDDAMDAAIKEQAMTQDAGKAEPHYIEASFLQRKVNEQEERIRELKDEVLRRDEIIACNKGLAADLLAAMDELGRLREALDDIAVHLCGECDAHARARAALFAKEQA